MKRRKKNTEEFLRIVDRIGLGIKIVKRFILLILVIFFMLAFALKCNAQEGMKEPDKHLLQVDVSFHLNKIYNINSVDETYFIDGYLFFIWDNINDAVYDEEVIYVNEHFPKDVYVPTYEFINVVGKREILNKRLTITEKNKCVYFERFHAKFNTPMNFKKYPLDQQTFNLQIESFTLPVDKLVFHSVKLASDDLFNTVDPYLNDWEITQTNAFITEQSYRFINEVDINDSGVYSRCNFEIKAKRKFGYYFWQVLLPIMLIIVASWLVFWVKDFSNQLNISFTLMLTVVAFNFFTSSLLPKLPYNTFIEIIIISGYSSLFLSTCTIIFNNALVKKRNEKLFKMFNRIFRWGFPLLYIIFLVILTNVLCLNEFLLIG